jgi:hypothetical protein
MNAPSQDIKDMLEEYVNSEFNSSDDLGLIYAYNLFIGKEPALPINCVTIYDTSGQPPYFGLTDVGYEYPSVHIRVRNISYLDGMSLANKIKDALHGRNNETWNDTLYTRIACTSGPAHLEWDDNGHTVFFINFNLQRR